MRLIAREQRGIGLAEELIEGGRQVGQARGIVQVGESKPRDPKLQVRGRRVGAQGSFHLENAILPALGGCCIGKNRAKALWSAHAHRFRSFAAVPALGVLFMMSREGVARNFGRS